MGEIWSQGLMLYIEVCVCVCLMDYGRELVERRARHGDN